MPKKTELISRRLTVGVSRELGQRLGVAAKLERKSAMQFTEEALKPAIDATYKRHGLRQ